MTLTTYAEDGAYAVQVKTEDGQLRYFGRAVRNRRCSGRWCVFHNIGRGYTGPFTAASERRAVREIVHKAVKFA